LHKYLTPRLFDLFIPRRKDSCGANFQQMEGGKKKEGKLKDLSSLCMALLTRNKYTKKEKVSKCRLKILSTRVNLMSARQIALIISSRHLI
jgi:hypothetical protein